MKTLKATLRSIITVSIIFFSISSSALDLENISSGTWNNTTIWKNSSTDSPCGCVPSSNDNVTIVVGTVSIPANYNASAKQIVVESNNTLRVGNPLSNAKTILKVGPSNFEGIIVETDAIFIVNPGDQVLVFDILNLNPNASKPAIRNEGEFLVASATSFVKISDSKAIGIHNTGAGSSFTNHGQILIADLCDDQSPGIINQGGATFRNEKNSIITIDNIDGSFSQAILNKSSFWNYGDIHINNFGSTGLDCRLNCGFYNHGTINIENSLSATVAINLASNSEFLNKTTGLINISNVHKPINNNNNFENEGEILIENTFFGITNSSSLTNYGLLLINGTNSNGINNKSVLSIFINHGTTKIIATQAAGLLGEDSARLFNLGTLEITGIDEVGIRVRSNADFENTGDITINNSIGDLSHGINVESGSEFENKTGGNIDIDNINGASFGLFNEGYFHNFSGAVLDIHDFQSDGLRNAVNSNLLNEGEIIIHENKSSTNSHGILNRGNFTNLSSINISRVFGVNSHGIQNVSFFESDGGQISIKTVTDAGIQNLVGNDFSIKNGTVLDLISLDIGIENSGDFTCNDSAIDIHDISQKCIHNQFQADILIENSTVSMFLSDDDGILNEGNIDVKKKSIVTTGSIKNEPLEVTLNATLNCELGSEIDINN